MVPRSVVPWSYFLHPITPSAVAWRLECCSYALRKLLPMTVNCERYISYRRTVIWPVSSRLGCLTALCSVRRKKACPSRFGILAQVRYALRCYIQTWPNCRWRLTPCGLTSVMSMFKCTHGRLRSASTNSTRTKPTRRKEGHVCSSIPQAPCTRRTSCIIRHASSILLYLHLVPLLLRHHNGW